MGDVEKGLGISTKPVASSIASLKAFSSEPVIGVQRSRLGQIPEGKIAVVANMSGGTRGVSETVKRKFEDDEATRSTKKPRKGLDHVAQAKTFNSTLLKLESELIESRQNYNNIPILIEHAKNIRRDVDESHLAIVVLCRVFCRLLAAGQLLETRKSSETEKIICRWLNEQYISLQEILLEHLCVTGCKDSERQFSYTTLLMQLFKEESCQAHLLEDVSLDHRRFTRLIESLLQDAVCQHTRDMFIEEFVNKYDDIRILTFDSLTCVLKILLLEGDVDLHL